MKKNNNIWIISQYAGSKHHGMNFRAYYLGKKLKEKGYNIRILAGSYSHLLQKLPNTNGRFTEEQIDKLNYTWVRTLRYKNSHSIGRIIAMFQFLINLCFYKSIEKPDVIIVSSTSSTPYLIAKKWATKYNAKLIFEVRDLWPRTLIELGGSSKYHPFIVFLQWIENYAYRTANAVVSVLPNAKEYMVEHGLAPNKFNYIPNGVDLTEEIAANKRTRKELEIPDNAFVIGYIGTLGIANAMDNLIHAAVQLKESQDIYFLIVGRGGAKKQLEQLAKRYKLSNVRFINHIPKNEVQSMLSIVDTCYIGWLNHSLYRFGISANKLFDYMLSGKPIIHASAAGNDPIAEANCGITIEPQNPEKVTKAIMQMRALGTEKRKQLGINGIRYVKKHHAYGALSDKYIKLIESI